MRIASAKTFLIRRVAKPLAMWFNRNRREIAQLRREVARLSVQLASAHQAPSFDPGAILAVALEGQAKQIGSTSDFIRMVHEIATERMAAAMGRKGGKRRAATATRDARGRMLPAPAREQTDCRLCNDPTTADFSGPEFDAHQLHKGRRARAPRAAEAREDEVIEAPQISVAQQAPEYPLPYVEHSNGTSGPGVRDSESDPTGSTES